MTDTLGPYPQFRLNFEQQGKRAKQLLKAARAGESEALARFRSPPRLAEAQYLIARELRFDNWASLKRHIAEMTLAREAMAASVPDSDLRTLHIRCGHDLQEPLKQAGFRRRLLCRYLPLFDRTRARGPSMSRAACTPHRRPLRRSIRSTAGLRRATSSS